MKGSDKPILEGTLFSDIKEEDSTWSIGKLPFRHLPLAVIVDELLSSR